MSKVRAPSPKRQDLKRPEQNITFDFSKLEQCSYSDCRDAGFFTEMLGRLKTYCGMTWNDLYSNRKHNFGSETLPLKAIKKDTSMFPDGGKAIVIRSTGDNRPILGYRERESFVVVYIETRFGDVYDHGCK